MDTLIELLKTATWPPYLVGIGIGILSWLAFLLSHHPIGVSTALAKSAGMVEEAVRGKKTREKLYYQENPPQIDWEWMLVAGLFLGAFAAAGLAGDVRWIWVPPMWQEQFGTGVLLRLVIAMAGGILVGFGARWGKGCTSGHGISGTLQLVLSSWLAVIMFFASGVVVAMLLYRV